MMTDERMSGADRLTLDPGGWLTCRVPCADAAGDDIYWLSESAEPRPGNLRFARAHGRACLLGELRDDDGLLTPSDVHKRLSTSIEDLASGEYGSAEQRRAEVSCVLSESNYTWSNVEESTDQWRCVATDLLDHRCELTASIIRGGVEVRSRLAERPHKLGEISRAALIQFLIAAHGRVRFARFVLDDRKVDAISFAAADRLEIELPDSVAAVAAASELIAREVVALMDQTLARVYLESLENTAL